MSEECCSREVLLIYSAVLSSINFVFLLVALVVFIVAFRKRSPRRQIYCFPESVPVKENNNADVSSENEDPHVQAQRSLAPLLSASGATHEDDTPIDLPRRVDVVQKPAVPCKDHIKSKDNIRGTSRDTNANSQARATRAAAQRSKGAVTLPHRITTQNPTPSCRNEKLKMINYELNKSEMFQRVSGEIKENHANKDPDSDGADGASTLKAAPNPKRQERRENDYQMSAPANEENFAIFSPDPYYHTVMQDPSDDHTLKSYQKSNLGKNLDPNIPSENCSLSRDPSYSFPLKKTTDKKNKTLPVRNAKPPQANDQTTKEGGGYESVNQTLPSGREHREVIRAEDPGEYSKLQRNIRTDGTDFVPAEGYDSLMLDTKDSKEQVSLRRINLSGDLGESYESRQLGNTSC